MTATGRVRSRSRIGSVACARVHPVPLNQANDARDRLRAGEVSGAPVLVP